MQSQLSERHHQYWRANLRITAVLLAIWFFVTFGWPFSFYVGAQGALIVYVVIIWFYARYMGKLDQQFGVAEEE